MVFVAYITSGRDKYEFETDFCGVFHNRDDAAKSVLVALINDYRIFGYRDDDEDCEEAYNEAMAKVENGTFTFADLTDSISKWNDSYYEEGWNYSISEVSIQ